MKLTYEYLRKQMLAGLNPNDEIYTSIKGIIDCYEKLDAEPEKCLKNLESILNPSKPDTSINDNLTINEKP